MANPFESSRYSIEHAKRRAREFESEVGMFFASNPYAKAIDINEDGTEEHHKVKLVKPLPVSLSGVAFDTVSSLRAALDQAAYTTATRNNPTKGDNAHFPFWGDLGDLMRNPMRKRSADVPKEVYDFMVSCKPYKGGNDLLWAMNKMCNTHKHELVWPAATQLGTMMMTGIIERPASNVWPPKWDRSKNELIYVRLLRGGQFIDNFQLSFFISFADIEAIAMEPADGVLNEMVRMISGIVDGIEAESRRIGLI